MSIKSELIGFPSYAYVQNVCKMGQGESTCRYLSFAMGGNGVENECQKAGPLREAIDRKIKEGTMGSKGDNCGGPVELIREKQTELIGNKVNYSESYPHIELDGQFEALKTDDGRVILDVKWSDPTVDYTPEFSEDMLMLIVSPEGINFSVRGLGSFAGETTLTFNKT